MRYSLLNHLACPHTHEELVCLVLEEVHAPQHHVFKTYAERANAPGALVGPAPPVKQENEISWTLRQEAGAPGDPGRHHEFEVKEGILVSITSGRWYPIRQYLPELLPDHLRDHARDFSWLEFHKSRIPESIFKILNRPDLYTQKPQDEGAHYKQAEMVIDQKVDPEFWGPGYNAPFNHFHIDHTVHLIKTFSFAMHFLYGNGPERDDRSGESKGLSVLDTGCGYSWTTEWLQRAGYEAIGFDIMRRYLDVAVSRLGSQCPALVVADSENLPFQPATLDRVLGYEAFHHLPNRKRAMSEYHRVLKGGGRVVLAEPDEAHEAAEGSQDVMKRYGTLEVGMELHDVLGYVRGIGFREPVQHFVIDYPVTRGTQLLEPMLSKDFIKEHSFTVSNLFVVEKPN